MEDKNMTRIEFAAYLNIDKQTVDRAIKAGMPAYKLGGSVRIPLNKAITWMSERARSGGKKEVESSEIL